MTEILYIPHGSDESERVYPKLVKPLSFISHMVQMKVILYICPSIKISIFISHMVQMKGDIWTVSHFPLSQLYIPHGSDERAPQKRPTF